MRQPPSLGEMTSITRGSWPYFKVQIAIRQKRSGDERPISNLEP